MMTAVGVALRPTTGRPMVVGSAVVLAIGIAYHVRFLKLSAEPTLEVVSVTP